MYFLYSLQFFLLVFFRYEVDLALLKNDISTNVTRYNLSKLDNPEHFKIGLHKIDFVHNYVYLGVIIDDVMSLNPLINNL